MARVLVVLERPEDAVFHAEQARRKCRYGGFWPAAGILRTLCWALRMDGEDGRADTTLEQLRALVGETPSEHQGLVSVLLDEAGHLPFQGGDVY